MGVVVFIVEQPPLAKLVFRLHWLTSFLTFWLIQLIPCVPPSTCCWHLDATEQSMSMETSLWTTIQLREKRKLFRTCKSHHDLISSPCRLFGQLPGASWKTASVSDSESHISRTVYWLWLCGVILSMLLSTMHSVSRSPSQRSLTNSTNLMKPGANLETLCRQSKFSNKNPRKYT